MDNKATNSLVELRESIDQALYDYVKANGQNPDEFDYSEFNDLIDQI